MFTIVEKEDKKIFLKSKFFSRPKVLRKIPHDSEVTAALTLQSQILRSPKSIVL